MTTDARQLISAFIALIITTLFSSSFASSAKVTWDANSESDLAGYNVYVGENSGDYTGVVDVGNIMEYTWANLDAGKTYYFAVTAYDFSGNESGFSDEVNLTLGSGDSNPPELVNVVVRGETQLDVNFSEPLEETSAEAAENYSISDGITVFGAVLDNNQTTGHLLTSAHQRGATYVLAVSNIDDLAGNTIAAGSSVGFSVPNPNGDSTPPQLNNVVVVDGSQLDIIFSESVSQSSAENIANFQINNGIQVLQASLTSNPSIVRLTTTNHPNASGYRLTVNDVEDLAQNKIVTNSSFSYDVNIETIDTTPPQVQTIVVNGATQIDVNFNEPVERGSAENKDNYAINNGIEVLGVILDDNEITAHLITSTHADDESYSLVVSNVRDKADNPNVINSGAGVTYVFEEDGRIDSRGTDGLLPNTFALFQNYPNPFNPTTQISYSLSSDTEVILTIHNLLGQRVRTLISKRQKAGDYFVSWNGKSDNGRTVAGGIYIYQLRTQKLKISKKLLFLK